MLDFFLHNREKSGLPKNILVGVSLGKNGAIHHFNCCIDIQRVSALSLISFERVDSQDSENVKIKIVSQISWEILIFFKCLFLDDFFSYAVIFVTA